MTAAASPSTRPVLDRRIVFALALLGFAAALLAAGVADNRIDLTARHAPPLAHGYLLGTDQLGRSLLLQAARAVAITVALGGTAAMVSVTLGFLLGVGNLARSGLARLFFTIVVDLKSGLPTFFVAILLGSVVGQTPFFLFAVLCFVGMEFAARATKDGAGDFVRGPTYRALLAEGVSWRRRFVHLLLHMSPVLVPLWALILLEAILVESGLSFVGLGLRPELASLGVLIREYYRVMLQNPWPIILATSILGAFCVGLFQLARRKAA